MPQLAWGSASPGLPGDRHASNSPGTQFLGADMPRPVWGFSLQVVDAP